MANRNKGNNRMISMLRIISITLAGAAMLIAWQAEKRSPFIVALLAILCGVTQAAATNPNIVVILADDKY